MQPVALDPEAGKVSAELGRLGIAATARVHVVVELIESEDDPSIASMAHAGGAFAWLADEPDLYADAHLIRATDKRV